MDNATTTAQALDETQPVTAVRHKKNARKARAPKLHKPKKESTKTITTRLYKTWSAIGHARAGDRCEVCGIEGKIDAHHVQPRQICSGLRFDPHNCCCLCASHHKWGKRSAHKGMLWFVEWFKNHRPADYEYLMKNLDKELDCKNRMALYAQEVYLHERYEDAVAPISRFDVIAYDVNKQQVHSIVNANNKRAAEYIFWNSWPKTDVPKLKGIWKAEEVRTPSFDRQEVGDGNA